MEQTTYDIAVLGAGSGGLTTAISMARMGKKVLLVEQNKPGGECTHSGCIPSKALLYSSKTGMSSEDAFAYVQSKIKEVYSQESPEMLQKMGIEYMSGTASFSSSCSISIDGQEYYFKKAVVSTGSTPRTVEIQGLKKTDTLTNQNFFEQSAMPQRLLILGSGPIGMEMAQAAANLGSKVTMITQESSLASFYHLHTQRVIARSFQTSGINTLTSSNLLRVEGSTAYAQTGQKELAIEFDKVLIAIGRVPNFPAGLTLAQVDFNTHGIKINSNYQTSNKCIYAIGDVSDRYKFTHVANHAGRAVVANIISRGWKRSPINTTIPKVTYTQPEIAQVGLTHTQAIEEYGADNIRVTTQELSEIDRAKTNNIQDGVCVVISKRLSGKILGAEIVGPQAGELITSFTLAIENGLSMWALSRTIYPYPTLSEVVKKTADQFVVHTLSTLRVELAYLAKKHSLKALAFVFWISLLCALLAFKNNYNMSNADALRALYNFMIASYWGPFIYIIVYVLRPLIFFPATLLTTLSGAIFGLPFGFLLTMIGENGSANLAYWIGRFFSKDFKLEKNKLIGPYVNKAQEFPFITVLLMRFLYVPFDLTNYSSGVLGVRWSAYFMATLVGIIPGVLTFVALGASLNTEVLLQVFSGGSITSFTEGINPIMLAFTALLFCGSLLLARYFKKRHTNTTED